MEPSDATIPVEMGFMPASNAIADPDHPGLLRAGPRTAAPYATEGVEVHVCEATDRAGDGVAQPTLLDDGFEAADLSRFEALQGALATVCRTGRVTEADAERIRSEILGATLPLANGVTAEVLFIADEGFIMRSTGPNRLRVIGPEPTGMNDHGAATSVHADQDVYGTPLAQLMEGRAPSLFRHDSPDGSNHDASLMLVNLWIPLQQITAPLVLADGRSVDRRRHQLRYGLPTHSFLDRDEDQVINDIWTFLHDSAQRWSFRSEMDHRSAYVFNTLSTPHGSCVLPGEDVAEACYRLLEAAEVAVLGGDAHNLTVLLDATDRPQVPERTTPALREAIAQMLAVIEEASTDPAEVCGARASQWLAASSEARRRVVRMSIEMRLVVSVEVPPTA